MSSSFFGEDFVGVKGVCRQKNFEGVIINICCNLPFDGRAARGLMGASSKGGRHAESPPVFIQEKHQENRNVWSTNFKCERFGSYFYARGRY